MAVYQVSAGDLITCIAETAVTAGKIVQPSGSTKDFQVKHTTDNNQVIVGVAYTSAAAGAPVSIQVRGIAKVTAGGSITQGAPVISDANAAGVTGTSAAVGLKYIVGYALEDAASADVISVLVAPAPYNTAVN